MPGRQPGAEKCQCPRADPAGCSGAGDPVDVDAEVAVQHLREPGQAGVQGGDVVRAGALLRAVDARRAARAGERVVDVAGHHDLGVAQPGVELAEVDDREVGEGNAARPQRAVRRGQEAGTEGRGETGAAVGGGAAADAEDHAMHPLVQGRGDQLTGAPGGRVPRVGPAAGQLGQPGRGRQLDHGGARRDTVGGQREGCADRSAGRSRDGALPAYPARRQHDGDGSLATVGHRPTPDLDRDPRGLGGVAQPGLDRRRRLVRGQAPRERVGGDDHGHPGRCGHTVTPALSASPCEGAFWWAETLAQPVVRSRVVHPAMFHADQGAGGVPWAQ